MKSFITSLVFLFYSGLTFAQGWNAAGIEYPAQSFKDAYKEFPNIPSGFLEAYAFTKTRFTEITPDEPRGCTGIPRALGIFGLFENGENYFRENYKMIFPGKFPEISEENFQPSMASVIFNFAAFLKKALINSSNSQSSPVAKIAFCYNSITEIPETGAGNLFAREADLYSIFKFLSVNENQEYFGFPDYEINLEELFGQNFRIHSSKRVLVFPDKVINENGQEFKNGLSLLSPDYPSALWNPAASCNYSNRTAAVSAITLHTVQGSYAGCISWFQNCAAGVSAHYVIRSSDGQITQMVLEADKAWHVGSENNYTVGIEHEGYVNNAAWYTTAMYQSSAALCADICTDHNINKKRTGFFPWLPTTYYNQSSIPGSCIRVKGHMHYPNQTHTDPGPNWNWDYFYKLVNPPSVNATYTAPTGNFYDPGGPSNNYGDDQRYIWTIAPTGAQSVSLTFNSFNLENTWDYLYIYNGPNVFSPSLGYWTGTNSPGTVTASSGVMTIEFRSDCATTAAGWNASWNSNVVTGTGSINAFGDFLIGPNPAHDFLEITFLGQAQQNTLVRLYDISGRIIFEQSTSGQQMKISLNDFQITPGLYFVEMSGNGNRQVVKIIVQ